MSKKAVILITLLFLILISAPVMAEVNLDINGKSFKPLTSPQLEDGITTVSLSVIARSLGADVSINDQDLITINENGQELQMTIGSTEAVFNGKNIIMPKAPERVEEEIMVPIRFVMETFGAEIGWQNKDKKVSVGYEEKRNGMTVEEMLAISSTNLDKCGPYKMKMDMELIMDARESGEENESINMSSSSILSFQKTPLLVYIQQNISAADSCNADNCDSQIEEMSSESLISEDGFYMTMPEYGWVKMELPGLDMEALMKETGNENPVTSIQEMKDYGVVLSYANDREKDGKKYWVINVTMGADSFKQYYQSMMDSIASITAVDSAEGSAVFQTMMQELMNNLKIDLVYDLWVEQAELLPRFMDLDARMSMSMEIPASETEKAKVEMDMTELASYEIYDLGVHFAVPDVSEAKDFSEIIQEQMDMSDIEVQSVE